MINRIPLTPPVIAGIVIADVIGEAMRDPEAFRAAYNAPDGQFFSILEQECAENDLFNPFISSDAEEEAFLNAFESETTWDLIRRYIHAFGDNFPPIN